MQWVIGQLVIGELSRIFSCFWRAGIALGLAVLLGGCRKSDDQIQTAITGLIRHQSVTQLPSDAELHLRLTDVTGQDGAAVELTHIRIAPISTLPYRYTLPFDSGQINASHRYTVDARIMVAGQLRYATDTPFAVLTEGQGRQADITLITAGATDTSASISSAAAEEIFRGELRSAGDITLYSAGFRDGSLQWLKEKHGNKQLLDASYQFKGGYLLHYRDSTGVEIQFNDQGKPVEVRRGVQTLAIPAAQSLISAARTRAALLRSHALASRDTKQHRLKTEQPGSVALR